MINHTIELQRLLELTPYARQVYDDAREEWKTATDPLRRAYLGTGQSELENGMLIN